MNKRNVVLYRPGSGVTRAFIGGKPYFSPVSVPCIPDGCGLNLWVLVDDETPSGPPAFPRDAFLILAVPPRIGRYSSLIKQRDAFVWGMPLWTKEELLKG